MVLKPARYRYDESLWMEIVEARRAERKANQITSDKFRNAMWDLGFRGSDLDRELLENAPGN
jgi:hypothetical protein